MNKPDYDTQLKYHQWFFPSKQTEPQHPMGLPSEAQFPYKGQTTQIPPKMNTNLLRATNMYKDGLTGTQIRTVLAST